MDLYSPVVDEDKFHPHFRRVSSDLPANMYSRRVLESWVEGFPDRDGKFVMEFQTTFNSSFWEVYLYAALRELGVDFSWDHYAPDFVVSKGGVEFVMEATTANAAKDGVPEWSKSMDPLELASVKFNELNRVAIIRLANAFMNKAVHYLDKYSKLDHVQGKPFVIAIAPFEQPRFNLQVFRAIEALLYDYYVDEEEYMANPENFPNGLEGKSLGCVVKDNGAEIELGFFDCGKFSHVSAVVFSSTATWGKVDAMSGNPLAVVTTHWTAPDGIRQKVSSGGEVGETITDGLRVYHNPYAKYPLDSAVFRKPGLVQMWADPDAREMIFEEAENSLHMRTAWVVNPIKDVDKSQGSPDSQSAS